jgi:hypothetical protein
MNTTIPKPQRLARLPLDHRGFVVPWFVQWFKGTTPCACGEGEPDFRIFDHNKFAIALKHKRCWLCGEKLGVYLTFVIGPMCAVNRVTSEPPCHLDCATYSAKVCPFLSRPRMRRNEHELPAERQASPGFHITRNPGAVCLWTTRSFRTFRPHAGEKGILINIGSPTEVRWYAEGRPASREQVQASIDTGLPALQEIAKREGNGAEAALAAQVVKALPLLPAA